VIPEIESGSVVPPPRGRRSPDAAYILAAALCLLLALPIAMPAALAGAGLAVALAYLPGALAAGRLAPGWSRAGRFLLALGLSVFLAGGAGSLLLIAGLDGDRAARVLLVLLALLSISAGIRRAASPAREAAEGSVWACALIWAAAMGIFLLSNPALLSRSDGAFHAAVTLQIANRGVPPEDPFFAGLRLLYFWGSHAWAGLWIALDPRIPVWFPLVVMNLAGAIACMLGLGLLAQRLGARSAGVRASALAGALGYAPFAWAWIAARAASGEVTGLAEVERLVHGGIASALGVMGTGLLHLSMVFFGGKFLVLTPFGLGLGIFGLFLVSMLDFLEKPTLRGGVVLSAATASALFTHTVVGFCCLGLAGGWWLAGLMRFLLRRSPVFRRARLWLPIAAGSALVPLAPYLAAILSGKRGGPAAGLSPQAIMTLVWGGALLVPIAVVWLWRGRERIAAAREILVLSLLLAIPALAIDPSDNNQSKFFNLLFFMLAAPAGIAWSGLALRLRGARRAALAALLCCATLPTAGLSLWAYASERGDRAEWWRWPTALESEAVAWAGRETSADAIFIDEGEARDLPVRAGRSTLWGGRAWAKKWGYPEPALQAREGAVRGVARRNGPSPEAAAFLSGLDRDVVLLARRRSSGLDLSLWDRLPERPDLFEPIYGNEDAVLYRWRARRPTED